MLLLTHQTGDLDRLIQLLPYPQKAMLFPILYSWLCCEIALSHDTEILVSNDLSRFSFLTRLDHTTCCWSVNLSSIPSFSTSTVSPCRYIVLFCLIALSPPSDYSSALASDHTSLSFPPRLSLLFRVCSHRRSSRIKHSAFSLLES